MITLDHLTRWYPTKLGRKYVLRDVSLKIEGGVNVGVCGRNGAGKSTLMRLLAGTDQPDLGNVKIRGSVSWPLGLTGGVQGSLSGRENTRFVCWVHGLTHAQVRAVEAFVLDFSELGRDYDLPVKNYSSGMRSRLTFGISMAFDFDYYLFDEVNAPGDARFKRKSDAALKNKKGRSNYVLVSQNIDQLLRETQVILVVNQGSVHRFDDKDAARAAFKQVMHVP
jgi:capsular polysaccharide transport system ATP-binding protein